MLHMPLSHLILRRALGVKVASPTSQEGQEETCGGRSRIGAMAGQSGSKPLGCQTFATMLQCFPDPQMSLFNKHKKNFKGMPKPFQVI